MNEGQPQQKPAQTSVAKGRYRIVRPVGQGGMGAVFEGVDTQSGRGVAIKVLRREVATDPQIVQRFLLEAETLSKIQHPNIVELIESGQEPDGSLYIVQELLSGADLRSRLEGQRMGVRDSFDIAMPIMGALVMAHEKGVLHRDIKPENIFLTRGPAGQTLPKLIDFGLSKFIGNQPQNLRLTRTGMPIGTPFYMSPEQARAEPDLDGQADVWSMATVIYEMIAGRCPHQESNLGLLMYKILSEPVPRIEQFAPQVPPDVAAVLHGALESDRARRFRSMRDFLYAVLKCPSLAAGPGEVDLAVRHKSSLPAKKVDALAQTMLSGGDAAAAPDWNPSRTAPFLLTPGGQSMKREIDKALEAVRRRPNDADDSQRRDSSPGGAVRDSFASTLSGDGAAVPRNAFGSTLPGPAAAPPARISQPPSMPRTPGPVTDGPVLGDVPATREESYSLGPAVGSVADGSDVPPEVPNTFPWIPVLLLTVLISGGITFALLKWRSHASDAPTQTNAVVDAGSHLTNSTASDASAASVAASDAASANSNAPDAGTPSVASATVDAGSETHPNATATGARHPRHPTTAGHPDNAPLVDPHTLEQLRAREPE